MSGVESQGTNHLFIRAAGATGAWTAADKYSNVKNLSFTLTNGKIVSTDFDDGDWENSVSDIKTMSIPVTANIADTNTVQGTLEAAAFNADPYVQFMIIRGTLPAAGAKNRVYTGLAQIDSFNPSGSQGGVNEVSFTLSSKGTVTRATDATSYPGGA